MLPLHNNGTKIGMGSVQSCEPQLPASKAFLVVVWLSCLQTRPAHHHYPRPPCPRSPCLFLCAYLLNCFVQHSVGQHSVGSFWWLLRHRQVPTSRCRRGINLLPCSRIKAETLPLWSKTNPSSTIRHLSAAISGRPQLTFLLSMEIGFPVPSNPLSLVIHFVSACSAVRTSKW